MRQSVISHVDSDDMPSHISPRIDGRKSVSGVCLPRGSISSAGTLPSLKPRGKHSRTGGSLQRRFAFHNSAKVSVKDYLRQLGFDDMDKEFTPRMLREVI